MCSVFNVKMSIHENVRGPRRMAEEQKLSPLDGVNKTPYNKEKSTYRRKEEH
jgi:hypothetical protein